MTHSYNWAKDLKSKLDITARLCQGHQAVDVDM